MELLRRALSDGLASFDPVSFQGRMGATLEYYRQLQYFERAQVALWIPGWEVELRAGVGGNPSAPEPLFDVASLTKMLVTLYLGHAAQRENPHFWEQQYKGVGRMKDLATHRTRLLSWLPSYFLKQHESLYSSVGPLSLQSGTSEPGVRRYSDVNFWLLSHALQQQDNSTPLLDQWWASIEKLLPAARDHFSFSPGEPVTVPTSLGNPFEWQLCQRFERDYPQCQSWFQDFNRQSMRQYRLKGECNDANAHFWSQRGEFLGHAGLFASLEGILQFIKSYWTAPQVQHWDELLTPAHALELGDDQLVGHHGFTGCTIALDRNREFALIFLSNRQFYGLNEQGHYPPWKEVIKDLFTIRD